MEWLKDRAVQRFAAAVSGGMRFLIAGFWLELSQENLPLAWWALGYIHQNRPIVFLTDLAPLVLGEPGRFARNTAPPGLQYARYQARRK